MRRFAASLWITSMLAGCSRSSIEPPPTLHSTPSNAGSGAPTASSLVIAQPLPAARRLKLELRADDLPSGGQRIVAVIPELGIEEPVGEAPSPFVCQTTLRPVGSEPLLTNGAKWLDIWCGRGLLSSIASDEGVLTLGKKQVPLPKGRFVWVKEVPQIAFKQSACTASDERIDVRLVAKGNDITLEIPKLGVSVVVEHVPHGSGFRCQTSVDRPAQRMGLSCATEPRALNNPWFQVVAGALIVEQTWQREHDESVGHTRWGIRLPCGHVVLKGVDFRDYRYGLRSCTDVCFDRLSACSKKCGGRPDPNDDACYTACDELNGRCLAPCEN